MGRDVVVERHLHRRTPIPRLVPCPSQDAEVEIAISRQSNPTRTSPTRSQLLPTRSQARQESITGREHRIARSRSPIASYSFDLVPTRGTESAGGRPSLVDGGASATVAPPHSCHSPTPPQAVSSGLERQSPPQHGTHPHTLPQALSGRRKRLNGAAPESNRPSVGLPHRTGFECRPPGPCRSVWEATVPGVEREKGRLDVAKRGHGGYAAAIHPTWSALDSNQA